MKFKKFIIYMLALLIFVPSGMAELRGDSLVGSCQGACDTTGDCGSGTYSGLQRGCDNGDPSISMSQYYNDAQAYLEGLGYCKSWYGASYSESEFTKKLGGGQCRYQAAKSTDNHYITYNDGPEPNPQPAYFCNGNPDLISPWGCVRDSIEEWHVAC